MIRLGGTSPAALALVVLCTSCGTPPAARTEAPLNVPADAGTSDAGAHKSSAAWRFVPADSMCFTRGGPTYCVELVSDDGDPAVVKPPHVVDHPSIHSRWRVEPDGHVSVMSDEGSSSEDEKEAAKAKRELAAQQALAKKLPPVVRLASTPELACGLLVNGDVTCWSEPKQMVNETPIVGAPALVPNAHGVTDFFLQPWSTLCVLTKENSVSCSPKLPATSVGVCMFTNGAVRCGASKSTSTSSGAGTTLEGVGFDTRKLLARPLVAIPEVTDAKMIAPYAIVPWYDNLSDRVMVVDVQRDGGCALNAKGEVFCWERDACPKGKDWQTQKVGGLSDIVALSLARDEGYAVDKGGQLHAWSRPAHECKAPAPAAKPFLGGVKDVHAGAYLRFQDFSSGSLACAAMRDDTIQCWRKLDEKPVVVQP